MRTKSSYIGILSASILVTMTSFAASKSPSVNTKTIYGLSNAAHFHAASDGQFYVQAGTFRTAHKAHLYQQQLKNMHHQQVITKKSGSYYLVIVGPLASASDVRAIGGVKSPVIPLLCLQKHIS